MYKREQARIRSILGERVMPDLEAAGYALRIREPESFVKRELAARDWKYMQQDADARTAVVEEIMARAEAGR